MIPRPKMDNITLHIKLKPLPLDQIQAQLIALIDSCGYKGAQECPIIRKMSLPVTEEARRALKPYPELEFQIKELGSYVGALDCTSFVEFLDALRIRQSRIFSQALAVAFPSFSKSVDWAFRHVIEQGMITPTQTLPQIKTYLQPLSRTNDDLQTLEIVQSTLAYHIRIRGDRTYPIHIESEDGRVLSRQNDHAFLHLAPIPPDTTYIPGSGVFQVTIGARGNLGPTGTIGRPGMTGSVGMKGPVGIPGVVGMKGHVGIPEDVGMKGHVGMPRPLVSSDVPSSPRHFWATLPYEHPGPQDPTASVPSTSTPPSAMPAPPQPEIPVTFPEETSAPQTPIDLSCTVCLDRHRNCLILPCNHLCCCHSCGLTLKQCPICRGAVGSLHPVFIV
jgi:hypothetical protein